MAVVAEGFAGEGETRFVTAARGSTGLDGERGAVRRRRLDRWRRLDGEKKTFSLS